MPDQGVGNDYRPIIESEEIAVRGEIAIKIEIVDNLFTVESWELGSARSLGSVTG